MMKYKYLYLVIISIFILANILDCHYQRVRIDYLDGLKNTFKNDVRKGNFTYIKKNIIVEHRQEFYNVAQINDYYSYIEIIYDYEIKYDENLNKISELDQISNDNKIEHILYDKLIKETGKLKEDELFINIFINTNVILKTEPDLVIVIYRLQVDKIKLNIGSQNQKNSTVNTNTMIQPSDPKLKKYINKSITLVGKSNKEVKCKLLKIYNDKLYVEIKGNKKIYISKNKLKGIYLKK